MASQFIPMDVPELVDWLDETYPSLDLVSTSPDDIATALKRAGARDLIRDLRAQLQHLQDSA